MKVCVYAICKNEKKFVEKWLSSMCEADYVVVLDTGSDDGTYELLKADSRVTRVERKIIDPWRFDVARNESLKLAPEDTDVFVCTDFDEVFNPGWAAQIKKWWKPGITTRGTYFYAWSHNGSGEPEVVFKYDKMHAHGYHWIYPVHEIVTPVSDEGESVINFRDTIYLHHYPDHQKSRAYYSDLVFKAVAERPDDLHLRILLGRELYGMGRKEEALKEFSAVLNKPDIRFNSKGSYLISLMFAMRIYREKREYGKLLEASNAFIKADPTYFEPYLFMGAVYNELRDYEAAKEYALAALKNAKRHYEWYEIPYCFQGWPQEILATAAYETGDLDEALTLMQEPLKYNPMDARLLYNENKMLKTKIESMKNS